MKRKGLTFTTVFAVFVVFLAVALAAFYFLLQNHVIVKGQLYSKDSASLDLRGRALSIEEYDTLAWRLPRTDIQWSVPFQGERRSNDLKELTVTQLSEDDLPLLNYFPKLTAVHAEGCTDYPALVELVRTHPELTVTYTVPIAGQQISSDTASVTVTSLTAEDAAMLSYLPRLTAIDGTQCRDYSVLRQVEKEHPEWQVSYTKSLGGKPIAEDATTLEITGAGYDELYYAIPAMANLKTVTIHSPKADSTQLALLQQEYPQLDIRWDMEFFGVTYNSDAEEIDISHAPLDSVETAKDFASKFPKLKKLILEAGSVPCQEIADYREEVRSQYKVVWTVYLTPNCKVRTDETYFMPIKQGEYYFREEHAYDLRYCEDMVCIDVGHSRIETLDFAAFMPHLKYLIITETACKDISGIADHKELIYFENTFGIVRDYTPLSSCTALEDLNLEGMDWPADWEPILQMTWLKNLFIRGSGSRHQALAIERLPNTRIDTVGHSALAGDGWRNLQNYYDMREYLGMPPMN